MRHQMRSSASVGGSKVGRRICSDEKYCIYVQYSPTFSMKMRAMARGSRIPWKLTAVYSGQREQNHRRNNHDQKKGRGKQVIRIIHDVVKAYEAEKPS